MTQDSKLAKLDWDDQGLPVSTTFDDVYFSKASGIDESRYVFVEGNQLVQRWEALSPNEVFTIGETGFGTGLNFLVAWQQWLAIHCAEVSDINLNGAHTKLPDGFHLHFCSVEKHPLSRNDLRKALALWPELAPLSQALIDAYPPQPANGLHKLSFNQGQVILNLFIDDAAKGLEQLSPITNEGPNIAGLRQQNKIQQPYIDAWFLDGFAPAKNPEMWSPQLFDAIANISHANTSFATFTVAGIVKRGLKRVGFEHKKIPGFGRKREMLVGKMAIAPTHKDAETERENDSTPEDTSPRPTIEHSWHLSEQTSSNKIQHCLVIGGGLAGCHTAFALANKGIRVTLLEQDDAMAKRASGNKQGVVYAKLSPHQDYLSRFNLSAQIFADHFYKTHNFYALCGQQCGVAHLAMNERQRELYQGFCKHFENEPDFANWLTKDQCAEVTGVESQYDALYLAQTGWLDPALLCQQLAQHPRIEVLLNTEVETLHYDQAPEIPQWHAQDKKNESICHADAVVIANAYQIHRFEQSQHLPCHKIRGQVSHIPENNHSSALHSVICGDGYIAPSQDGQHAFGATFTKEDDDPALRQEDHSENLNKLATLSPNFAPLSNELNAESLTGKVGWRCATPDYFPIVGPVANYINMLEDYSPLRKQAKKVIDKPGNYHPNLFCAIGFGSRGLCYAPICADLLASLINQEFLPVSRDVYRYLNPARFIIRDLMRNKI